jgi:hypothetical protein
MHPRQHLATRICSVRSPRRVVRSRGVCSYTEFCFAVAQTAYASAATGREVSAIDLLKEVISATQQAQTEAKNEIAMPKEGAKDEYAVMDQRNSLARSADVDALHDKTSLDDWYDSIGAVVTVALCPCHLWCSVIGQSSCAGAAGSGTHLMGLANVVGYITTCKEANATYYWSIQNYHYETHVVTTQDANGNTQTRTEQRRVNTHFACASHADPNALVCSRKPSTRATKRVAPWWQVHDRHAALHRPVCPLRTQHEKTVRSPHPCLTPQRTFRTSEGRCVKLH